MNSSLNIWILRIVQVLYALILGACFLVGEAISNWGVILLVLAVILLFTSNAEKLSGRDWVLIGIFWSFFAYFGWREWASPFSKAEPEFFYENLVFLYAPILLVAFRNINIDWIFSFMARAIIPLMVIAIAIAWYQSRYLGMQRADVFANNALSFVMFVALGFYLSLANFRELPKWSWPVLALIWLAAWYAILDFSESRLMAVFYPAFAMIFLVYVFCSFHYSLKTNLFRLSVIGAVGVVSLAALITMAISLGMSSRLEELLLFVRSGEFNADPSAGFRVEMYRLALENLDAVPIFGMGPESTFKLIIDQWPFEMKFHHLHNDALNLYVGGGFLGFIFYLALSFWPLTYFFHKSAWNDRFFYVATMIFAVIFTNGLFSRVILHQERTAWYVLALVFLQTYYGYLARKFNDSK